MALNFKEEDTASQGLNFEEPSIPSSVIDGGAQVLDKGKELFNSLSADLVPTNQSSDNELANTETLPTTDDMIVHPDAVQEVTTPKVRPVKLSIQDRNKLSPKEYVEYINSLTPEDKELAQEEDLRTNPELVISRKLLADPILSMAKGIGDTFGLNQALGLGRLGSFFTPESRKIIEDKIITMNAEVSKSTKVMNDTYSIGAWLGRNATQIAAAVYSGGSVPVLMMLESGATAIDQAAQPAEGSDESKPLYEVAKDVGVSTALAGTAGLLTKVAPYALRGFQSKNIHEALNPTTELGRKNYEALADAIEIANKNNIRLSDMMIRGSGKGVDGVALVEGTNYFVLREMYKASDEFSAKSLDMLQDIVKVGKRRADELHNKITLSEKRQASMRYQKEVQKLRDKYRQEENKIWGKVEEALPTGKIDITDFADDIKGKLTNEGIDPSAIAVVDKMIRGRFKTGYKELTQKANELRAKRLNLKNRLKNWKSSRAATHLNPADYTAKYKSFIDNIKDLDNEITQLNKTVRISPKDLYMSIKLLNKKINVPGGAISLKDANEIRGLRIAKNELEDKLHSILQDTAPEVSSMWKEAKDLTIQRVNSFGSNHNDVSMVLTNALLDGDIPKVSSMLKDPEMGLQHMEFIKTNFGKDSAAFKSAAELYLRAKLSIDDSVLKLGSNTKLISGVRGDFTKLSTALSHITPADIQFIKSNVSPELGKNLNGLIRLVQQYDEIGKGFISHPKGRGQLPGWQYAGKNPLSEGPGILADLITYSTQKSAYKLLGSLPIGRAIIGGGLPAIMGDSEDKDYYKNIIEGVGIGYTTGIIGRHLFERQIDEVMRVMRRRRDPKSVTNLLKSFKTKMLKTAKAVEDGKFTRKAYGE